MPPLYERFNRSVAIRVGLTSVRVFIAIYMAVFQSLGSRFGSV